MSLATLTNAGRAAIVKALKDRPIHLAWGTGLAEWDATDAVLPGLTGRTELYNEIGRRAIASSAYVTPDEEGDIVIPITSETSEVTEVRYSIVTDPTPYLYLITKYDFKDAPNAVIRELGVFIDTVVSPGIPTGQKYVIPSEISDPGILLAMQCVKPAINRSPSVRQTIEFVLPI
jgi:hypothetical protein